MSKAINDGGPAFPMADPFFVTTPKSVDEAQRLAQGMSLRDHFAGLAMQADAISQDSSEEFSFDERAEWAYQQADAMLRAREKEPPCQS